MLRDRVQNNNNIKKQCSLNENRNDPVPHSYLK